MDFNEYIEETKRTRPLELDLSHHRINSSMGLAGETGEILDLIKKIEFQGHTFNKEKIIEELGDVMWYLAYFVDIHQIDIHEVMEKNIQKLKKRYPKGFSHNDSVKRVDVT